MSTSRRRIATLAVSSIAALSLGLAGCAVGEIGGDSGAAEGQTEITYLFGDSGGNAVTFAEALTTKFNEMNPDIKVTIDTQPAGTEGDNLIKTRLATGEMADVFGYNSGSLFQALNPDKNLVPLTDEPWAADLPEEFKTAVSADSALYGAPNGTTQAGGVIYNKKVYAELGLKIPTTWAEFMANNDKIKAAGKVDRSSRPTARPGPSQLFVLGDFANVAAKDPKWAEQYTANKRKYVDQPALQSFDNQQDASRPATTTRTSPRPSTTTGSRLSPPARRRTTRCSPARSRPSTRTSRTTSPTSASSPCRPRTPPTPG